MDRKSAERVGRILGIWLLFIGLAAVFCFFRMQADYREAVEEILWIKEEYPEMEPELVAIYQREWQEKRGQFLGDAKETDIEIDIEEIRALEKKYGYTMWTSGVGKRMAGMFAAIAALSGSAFLFLFLGESHSVKKQKQAAEEEMLTAAEWVDRYQRGIFSKPEMNLGSEEALLFQEKMQQLGSYLEDFKERSALEENNTKTLVTNISHQLKTPLASLRMSQELLESQDLTETERDEFLLNNRRELEKLESLLEEMLKVSRLESHMIKLKPEPASLRETLIGAVNTVYMKAFARQMEISLQMDMDIMVYQDARWTQEVFVNVLDNAVKYSPNGSKIQIRVQKMIRIALVEIEDQGIGILPEEYHKVFKRFYRGENAADMEKEGAGVGLYLARSILEQQGGSVRVKSRSGSGSTFQITLELE